MDLVIVVLLLKVGILDVKQWFLTYWDDLISFLTNHWYRDSLDQRDKWVLFRPGWLESLVLIKMRFITLKAFEQLFGISISSILQQVRAIIHMTFVKALPFSLLCRKLFLKFIKGSQLLRPLWNNAAFSKGQLHYQYFLIILSKNIFFLDDLQVDYACLGTINIVLVLPIINFFKFLLLQVRI